MQTMQQTSCALERAGVRAQHEGAAQHGQAGVVQVRALRRVASEQHDAMLRHARHAAQL
jgi:hypothetical protein